MRGRRDTDCGRTGHVPVRERQYRLRSVFDEFPAHNCILAGRHSRARTDLPFVFQDERWVPTENASLDVEVAWTATELDRSSCSSIHGRAHHVPLCELLGVGDSFPDGFGWMREAALEGECGVCAGE